MALVGTNSFALLQDDVEDADENSVNKEALVTEKKPASAPAKDTKPAAKDEKATQKRGSGSARGRGRGRGNNDRADYEQGPPMKGPREHRNPRHSDRRDHPSGGMRSAGKREHDRKSGTGRGREVSKRGAGGKYVFGNDITDARAAEQSANAALQSGADEETAVKAAQLEPTQDEADITNAEEPVEGDEEMEGKVAEEEKDITIEEFERMKLEASRADDDIFAAPKPRRLINDGDSLGEALKKDEPPLAQPQTPKKSPKSKKSPADVKNSATADFFASQNAKPSSRRGDRDNRRGNDGNRGGYSGRSRQAPAPSVDDVSAFPSLGG
uniref:Hyaluronan/mRNA-binding protein domain-containing protein n=3 Tax=Rhodosorus marinus TaxID=101924 RepID=A0A7S3A558_9RHOD|mmetsp:Transcript_45119/g.175061  ORF Transcript_45119/g.175061 Transcript_45119/m.175061 type:complete len:326 (+) Transcript_45119:61-1038(+)|eukprot:CAMPEP_0113970512 /NCGR_PEP_ID=MMETSP0011_2-20120614/11262_1 /TAXON_ID=101924 /ORGANISM="Rhodosorus marinus" /LENGTH=325 /DNA_ID=CAMNT_0000984985 /DNA_START=82 /DNA_END=1059 /DNA_ORIENTATION=- /assembly_acc=CAM_ASM_000156